MRYLVTLLFILSCIALPLFSATAAGVGYAYAEPQEAKSLEKFSAGGRDYWIVSIGGVETFLVDDEPKIITSTDEIDRVLVERAYEEMDVSGKKQAIIEGIMRFEESQYPLRSECERTTGVDKMACYDKDSCIKACYAVPLCAMQIRDDLVLAILDWNILRQEFDASIAEAKSKAEGVQSEKDYRDTAQLIKNMEDKMRELQSSRIYTIPYCKNMSPDYEGADRAIADAESVASGLADIVNVKRRAATLSTNTAERLLYWGTRISDYERLKSSIFSLQAEIEGMYLVGGYVDEEIEDGLEDTKNRTILMAIERDAGRYKVAIAQGTVIASDLESLKGKVQMGNAMRTVLDSKARDALESISKADVPLAGTKYSANLSALRDEVNEVVAGRPEKSELSRLTKRMEDLNNEVKLMVAEAIMEGVYNTSAGAGDAPPVVPGLPVADGQIDDILPDLPKQEDGGVMSILCSVVGIVSGMLGFNVDFLGLCT